MDQLTTQTDVHDHSAQSSHDAPRSNVDQTNAVGIPTEHVCCPNCGADDWDEHARFCDLDFGVPGQWRLVHCRWCDLIYMNPRPGPSAFHMVYPRNYVPYQMELRDDTRWMMKYAIMTAYEGAKLKEIDRLSLPPNPRCLDVGCGGGVFLGLLKQRGWVPVGVEPNSDLVSRARERHGLDVRFGTLSTAPLEENFFDVITLWHALEHDSHPAETLARCYQLLKPGGVAIVQVPDHDSWEARVLKNYFWSNDIPRHLNFFTAPTLTSFVAKRGFRVESLRRTKNATSWLWTLLRWLRWDLYAQMEKNIGLITALYLLIAPVYSLVSRGDWITMIIRRPRD
jgi:2-polyprenyl-3-methyl-5-hydroxy-6-metoxy-1,4-benzoquinol methylase